MKFKICIFDNDYHTVTDYEFKEFNSKEEAIRYCKESSWRGEIYFLDEEYKGSSLYEN
jgi:hypothetical protein